MPQMSPMNWSMLMNYFLIIYFITILILYFYTSTTSMSMTSLKSNKKFSLKWY